MSSRIGFRRKWLWFAAALLPICLLGWSTLLRFLGRLLVENDGAQKAQAAVVLGGDEYGSRILKAAQLVQAGYAPFAVVSGPWYLGHHECDYTIAYAKEQGYPAVLFHPWPNQARSTRSETRSLGQYLRAQNLHHVLLVTSNYHTHRAAYLMRRQNPDLQVDAVAAPDPEFNPDSWWKTRGGQKVFLLEWTKTLATYLGD